MKTYEKNGKTYRRLRKGEIIRATDWQWTASGDWKNFAFTCSAEHFAGDKVQKGYLEGHGNHFYREVSK